MKTLWLVREPCTVLFDVKPIHEALSTEKLPSSIEVELTEEDYDNYQNVLDLYFEWQEILEQKFTRKIV